MCKFASIGHLLLKETGLSTFLKSHQHNHQHNSCTKGVIYKLTWHLLQVIPVFTRSCQ